MGLVAENRVDGFIFLAVEDRDLLNRFVDKGIPIISADYIDPDLRCDTVVLDHVQGARLAVDYCLEQGHKNFAIAIRTDPHDYPSIDRRDALLAALAEHGIDLPSSRIFLIQDNKPADVEMSLDMYMREQYTRIMTEVGTPVTFLAAYSYHASGLRWAAETLGHAQPDAVPIVAFGAVENSPGRYVIPGLVSESSILGTEAARRLLARVRGERTDKLGTLYVPFELVDGGGFLT